MTCCKEIPVLPLNLPLSELKRLEFFYKSAKRKVFINRYNLQNWFSLSFVDNEVESNIVQNFPSLKKWCDDIKKSEFKEYLKNEILLEMNEQEEPEEEEYSRDVEKLEKIIDSTINTKEEWQDMFQLLMAHSEEIKGLSNSLIKSLLQQSLKDI